ncbi:MAG: tRNA threonylcarbamoyladenosine dehydratase [Spirochaetales bacterium]|nr:tRNA threonylcarbamoyladenosine dehydratase [Spirochaetales bacterium]
MTHSGRFVRAEMLLGKEGMKALHDACVTVVGLGAVGSYAVEALARLGVGRLLLVDFDVIRPSNINRQLYALESTVGRKKTSCARERVLDINPRITVETFEVFSHTETIGLLLEHRPDALLDAIDGLSPKATLLAACVERGIPVVSSMGAACRTDPSLIRTGDISETAVCPLALRIRKRLKKPGIHSGIRCVYSTERPATCGASGVPEETGGCERGRKRTPLGSLSYITGIFGLLAAYEIHRLIAQK